MERHGPRARSGAHATRDAVSAHATCPGGGTDGVAPRARGPFASPLRVASALGVAGAVGFVALVLVIAAAQWIPSPGWLSAAGAGRGAWAVSAPAAVLACATAAWLGLRHPRRLADRPYRPGSRGRISAPLALAALALAALLLAFDAYLPCSGNRLPVWDALSRALAMLSGNFDADAFTGRGSCPSSPPLSAQLGYLLAQLVVVLAGAGVLAAIFPRQVARLRARHGRAIVVIGADPQTLPLIDRIQRTEPDRCRVVVADDAVPPSFAADLRARGWLAVDLAVDEPDRVAPLLLDRRGRWRFRGLYLLAADPGDNLRRLRMVRTILKDRLTASPALPPRLQIRLDDPFQAEDWRRRHMSQPSGRWLFDAQSRMEATADAALAYIESRQPATVVVAGDSPFALALVERIELNRRSLAAERLGTTPTASRAWEPRVVVAGPRRDVLARKLRAQRSRFGEHEASPHVSIAEGDGLGADVKALLDRRAGLLVLADAGAIDERDAEVAASHPGWDILAWDPRSTGLSDMPAMGRMRTIGPTFERPAATPLDVWERLGMVGHRRYLNASGASTPGDPTHGAWADLSPFVRGSNVRQVFTTLTSVARAGFSWAAADESRSFTDPTGAFDEEQLLAMARREHAEWCAYHRQHGWRRGRRTDPTRREHADLVEWDELSAEVRRYDVEGVVSVLASMAALGYRLRAVGVRQSGLFHRKAVVRARRLRRAITWNGPNGATLRAARGDWLVDDGSRRWSVRDDIFHATYRPLSRHLWRASGTVRAARASTDTVVHTLEGDVRARPGDWIISGAAGESWPSSPEVFWSHYEPVS